uniref:Uncharacterized protein n=1 Tax=Anguilla anguilla TaxID=7936 RepID=A0A0E9WX46_ANGAN
MYLMYLVMLYFQHCFNVCRRFCNCFDPFDFSGCSNRPSWLALVIKLRFKE